MFDLSALLNIAYDDKSPESDLEGAARLGDVAFFISSHGRDRQGRLRLNRMQFFALKMERSKEGFAVRPFGSPYKRLLDDMASSSKMKGTGIIDAYRPQRKKDERLRPKRHGVNIEGLAAGADGKTLLIGFRNPRPQGKALIVELKNPLDVVLRGTPASFGDPILLDLGGRGIRSLEYFAAIGRYLIVAGAADDSEGSQLFLWTSGSSPERVEQGSFEKDWNLESVVEWGGGRLLLLSDDGTRPSRNSVGKPCPCKELDMQEAKSFRAFLMPVPRPAATDAAEQ